MSIFGIFFYDASLLGAGFKHGESWGEPDEVGLRPEAISHPQRFPKRQRGNRPELKYVQGNAGTSQYDILVAVDKVCVAERFTEVCVRVFQDFTECFLLN